MSKDNHVVIENLTFSRGERVILRDIHIEVERSKVTAIMGPSGTGKTTLLKLIGAQLSPDSGSILVNGENLFGLSQAALANARKDMGLLFQSSALFTNLTVYENVAFPLREHTNLSEAFIRSVVLMKLEAVGLRGVVDFMPAQLSGGMARRVALARAIALDPALIMYDEPFAGQDPISMGVILKLIKTLNQELGLTTIIVSHDVQETISIADKIYLISENQVVAEGTAASLLKDQSPYVSQFMHGLPDGVLPFHYPAKNYIEDLLHG